jgi:hypothetical protein
MNKALTLVFIATIFLSACRKPQVGIVSPVIDPNAVYDNRAAGASANDILNAKKYGKIRLEFSCASLHMLDQEVMDDVKAYMQQYCNKPNGVDIYAKNLLQLGNNLSVNDLYTIERSWRQYYTGRQGEVNHISIYILVTDGTYTNENVLGIAYRNTAICLFDGKITSSIPAENEEGRNTVRKLVIKHELGRLMGLVNSGTAMQTIHEDEVYRKTCSNPKCLMHHTVATTELFNTLTNGAFIPELDENCKNDLVGNGGKI